MNRKLSPAFRKERLESIQLREMFMLDSSYACRAVFLHPNAKPLTVIVQCKYKHVIFVQECECTIVIIACKF